MPRAKTQPARTKRVTAGKEEERIAKEISESADKKPSATKTKTIKKEVDTAEKISPQSIDIDALKEELTKEIKKQVEFEYKKMNHVAEQSTKTQASLSRSELVLSGNKTYNFVSNTDGFSIKEGQRTIISANNSGSVGIGIASPRGYGPGSMHIKSNYTSEASLPISGEHVTRGLIVEGDADDHKNFTLRVVSRKNRQGLNVTGDGSLILGLVEDESQSRFTVYQPNNDRNAIHAHVPSRYFNANMINLETASTSADSYNFISAKNQCIENNDQNGQEVFAVNGEGSVHTDQSYFTNRTGYAELFEWADGNSRNENRLGFTVSLDSNGYLRVADEGDDVIGVVVQNAAVVGNAAWNKWHTKYYLDEMFNDRKMRYHVIEWENHNNTVESYFNSTLPRDFQIPENAITYETHEDGSDMYTGHINGVYKNQEYTSRTKRREWATVVLYGTVTLWKGQLVDNRWVKVADLNDDLERWIIK